MGRLSNYFFRTSNCFSNKGYPRANEIIEYPIKIVDLTSIDNIGE